MSRSAVALVACCSGLWLGSAQSFDASVLVQMSGMDLAEHEQRVQRMKHNMLFALEVAALNWGSVDRLLAGSADPEPSLAEAASDSAGCSEQDQHNVKTSLDGYADKLDEVLGQVVEQLENGQMPQPLSSPGHVVMPPARGMVPSFDMKSLGLPPSCANVNNQGTLITCVHQALNVSKPCIRCVPQFASRIETCADGCGNTLDGAFEAVQQVMAAEMMKNGMNPDPEELSKALDSALNRELKKFVPCVQCMKPKISQFVGCIGMNSLAGDITAAMDEAIGVLQSANITGRIQGGPSQQQQQQPQQKMLFYSA